jgi:hypothetical protein
MLPPNASMPFRALLVFSVFFLGSSVAQVTSTLTVFSTVTIGDSMPTLIPGLPPDYYNYTSQAAALRPLLVEHYVVNNATSEREISFKNGTLDFELEFLQVLQTSYMWSQLNWLLIACAQNIFTFNSCDEDSTFEQLEVSRFDTLHLITDGDVETVTPYGDYDYYQSPGYNNTRLEAAYDEVRDTITLFLQRACMANSTCFDYYVQLPDPVLTIQALLDYNYDVLQATIRPGQAWVPVDTIGIWTRQFGNFPHWGDQMLGIHEMVIYTVQQGKQSLNTVSVMRSLSKLFGFYAHREKFMNTFIQATFLNEGQFNITQNFTFQDPSEKRAFYKRENLDWLYQQFEYTNHSLKSFSSLKNDLSRAASQYLSYEDQDWVRRTYLSMPSKAYIAKHVHARDTDSGCMDANAAGTNSQAAGLTDLCEFVGDVSLWLTLVSGYATNVIKNPGMIEKALNAVGLIDKDFKIASGLNIAATLNGLGGVAGLEHGIDDNPGAQIGSHVLGLAGDGASLFGIALMAVEAAAALEAAGAALATVGVIGILGGKSLFPASRQRQPDWCLNNRSSRIWSRCCMQHSCHHGQQPEACPSVL